MDLEQRVEALEKIEREKKKKAVWRLMMCITA